MIKIFIEHLIKQKLLSIFIIIITIIILSQMSGFALEYEYIEEKPTSKILTLNIWCELEPMIKEGDEYPLSSKTAAKRILEEARVIFSAMIYGYNFSYTPYDKTRVVKDKFELIPVSEIEYGDPMFKIIKYEKKGNKLYCKVIYRLTNYQAAKQQSWASNTMRSSCGRGEKNLFTGFSAKLLSFKEAIKQAVRNYAKKQTLNKPQEIKGQVIVWDEPYTVISSGSYISTVKIKLSIKTLRPYKIF